MYSQCPTAKDSAPLTKKRSCCAGRIKRIASSRSPSTPKASPAVTSHAKRLSPLIPAANSTPIIRKHSPAAVFSIAARSYVFSRKAFMKYTAMSAQAAVSAAQAMNSPVSINHFPFIFISPKS